MPELSTHDSFALVPRLAIACAALIDLLDQPTALHAVLGVAGMLNQQRELVFGARLQ